MHSAVMQNKNYIKFAELNTVEVLSMSGIGRAVEQGRRRAAQYEVKGADGQMVKRMVAWPNLTLAQVESMRRSQAGRYNNTGGIPHTAVIDPFSQEQIEFHKGSFSQKSLQKMVMNVRAELLKQHGKTKFSRKNLRSIDRAELAIGKALAKDDLRKAMDAAKKIGKKAKSWPTIAQERTSELRERVIEALQDKFTAIEELSENKPVQAKRKLGSLLPLLQGTPILAEAKALMAALIAAR